MPKVMRDIFICHANEDKRRIVDPIVKAFDREKITYWYDKADIEWGDSIPKGINEGLATSRYVLVVLSPAFLEKAYAQEELMNALHEQASTGATKVLPLLVGTKKKQAEILDKFRLLTSRNYITWDRNADKVVASVLQLLDRGDDGKSSVSRVCFISSEYPPRVLGGLGVHVDQLSLALSEHLDVDVVLASPGGDRYLPSHQRINLHPLMNDDPSYDDPISWLYFAQNAADKIIQTMVTDTPPEVIHCHDWVTVLAGIKCRRRLNIPLVFHLHLPNPRPLCASIEYLGLICADLVTVNSHTMREELAARQLQPGWVEVVKNGVDLKAFRPCDDWPADDGYILFVGRLVEQKGVDYLLRAFYILKGTFPEVRLKIVGDGGLRPILERLCTSLLISDRVDFLGWRTGQELVKFYQKARVVVVPSVYEPFGMTALEAQACQRPVVASNVGGLREIIQPNVNGLLAERKNELDLAQAIMALLGNSDLRNRLGKNGLAWIVDKGYTWPQIAQRFIELYKRLLEKPMAKSFPNEAGTLKVQIREAAREINPSFDVSVLNRLFDWGI